jgi:hypothetical protein
MIFGRYIEAPGSATAAGPVAAVAAPAAKITNAK